MKFLKYKLLIGSALLSIFIGLIACDKEIWPARVITTEPSEISQASAILNGEAVMDMSTKIGFEFGTTTDYGYSIYSINILTDTNTYYISCFLTPLSPNTTYHYRIKAESSAGIIYGSDVSFTTLDNSIVFNPDLDYGSVSDIDGNIYKTIQIGTQTWMAENLKTTRYNDGTPIKLEVDGRQWFESDMAVYCWLNNEEAKFKDTYGALYNWQAVNSYKLCPTDWHVPTDAEWGILNAFLGGLSNLGYKIMETGSTHWLYPSLNTTNESGFTALPGGYRNFEGTFKPYSAIGYWKGSEAYWWSSSTAFERGAYYWAIYENSYSLLRGSWRIEMGLSVRCLKNN